MALANSLDCINALSVALCSLSEPALDDGADVAGVLRVSGLALVAHLHDGAAVVGVRGVLHILDPPVRKGNLIFSDNVSILVPRPDLTEVSVVCVVMDSVLEGEGVGLLVIPAVMVDLRHNGGAVHSAVDYGGRGGDGVMN